MRLNSGIAISLAAVVFAGCAGSSANETKEELKSLPVTRLEAKDTMLYHSYVADIQALQNVEIRARVHGFLESVHVDEGEEVQKGQLLFRISDGEYKAELSRAKAALSNVIAEAKAASLEADRVKLLTESKVLAPSELEVARARLAAAEAKADEARSTLTNAEAHLRYTEVRAPFAGVIDRIPLKTGSLISEGALFTTLSDVREVYAYFSVSETEYLHYSKTNHQYGDVHLVLADGTDYPNPGKIETIEGEFEESTGSIAFRARFANPRKLLKHGASGKIKLSTEVDEAVIVPQKAVFEMQDRNYVFVVDEANKVKMRNFIPQTRMSHFYIVQSGLEPGERVVAEGVRNIRDGMLIAPRIVTIDSLLNM
ncbi:efflux RND transporter periplasmic adaptor subunit [uncultured Chitinophaga sp.]|uniref:efflux RND transporter periplasmic adaptor subunit n=1 Tax=uncultured Chitinophaga sp. TaxID=339340 RepID=UPI0025D3D5E6|nr:efflux RND transporter periplasmic adaptor subunit [uncultured Chitinophaga sp.]